MSNQDAETLAFLTLSHSKGLGPRKIKLLVEALGSASTVLEADIFALAQIEGFGPSTANAIQIGKQSDWAQKEITRAQILGVTLLHLNHPDYPECLKAIYDPPSILYVRGELPKLETTNPKAFGIVGTRNASDSALEFTKQMAASLASVNVVINSGLALGVDTKAHQGAIETGKTIAVLGSGVDYIYPSQNRALAKTIFEGKGAVISEYPLGTKPMASNFPGRNRIINGLSRGVLVIEAAQKSGALITADFALQEGRTVFAMPGKPNDPRSSGTRNLLKQGAILVDCVEDILNEFNWGEADVQAIIEFSEEERTILKAILDLENPIQDNLAKSLNKATFELLPKLTMLELRGLIKLGAGGRYSCLVRLD